MIESTVDHVHLRSPDPGRTARFYIDNLGAKPVRELQVRGVLRVVIDLGGLAVFIEEVPADLVQPPSPPFQGLEHIGLRVADLDSALAALAARGIVPIAPAEQVQPGVRIAFIEGPERVRIELLERNSGITPA